MATAKKKSSAKSTRKSTPARLRTATMTANDVMSESSVLTEVNGTQYINVPVTEWARLIQQQAIQQQTTTTANEPADQVGCSVLTSAKPIGRLAGLVCDVYTSNRRTVIALQSLDSILSRITGGETLKMDEVPTINETSLLKSLDDQNSTNELLLDHLFTYLKRLDELI